MILLPAITSDDVMRSPDMAKKQHVPFRLPEDAIPAWLPADSWRDYEAARNESAHPMTEASARAALRKLDRMCRSGVDVADVLDQSTAAGWRGLFADSIAKVNGVSRSAAPREWLEFREAIRTERMPEDKRLQRIITKLGGLWTLGSKPSEHLDRMRTQFEQMLAMEAH